MMRNLVSHPLRKNHYDFMKEFLQNDIGRVDKDIAEHIKTLQDKEASQKDYDNALIALIQKLNDELEALKKQQSQAKTAPENNQQLAENIQKLELVLKTLSTDYQKKAYDAALKAPESDLLMLTVGGKPVITMRKLVSENEIEGKFKAFEKAHHLSFPSLKDLFDDPDACLEAFSLSSLFSSLRKPFSLSTGVEINPKSHKSGAPSNQHKPFSLTMKSGKLPDVLDFPNEEMAKKFAKRLLETNMAILPDGSQDPSDCFLSNTKDYKRQMEEQIKKKLGLESSSDHINHSTKP